MAEAPASFAMDTDTRAQPTEKVTEKARAPFAAEKEAEAIASPEIEAAKMLLIQGIKSSRRGDFKQAIAFLSEVLSQDSFDLVITLKSYYYRGCALSSLGWYEAAIADFSQVIQFSDRATKTTPVAVPATKLTELYIHRGNAYRQLSQYTRAAADLDQGVTRSGGSAQSYACRGLLRLDIENFVGAINDFTRALYIHPTFAQCHLWRGSAYLLKGHPEEAADDLSRAIESIPASPEAYNQRGIANIYLSRFSQALLDFDQAIRLNPKFAEAYSNRGSLRQLMGDVISAEVDCDRALALNPLLSQNQTLDVHKQRRSLSASTAYESYQQGIAHLQNNDAKAAIQSFNAAIARSPDYADPYIYRCIAHFYAHDRPKALEDFERIITNVQLSHPSVNHPSVNHPSVNHPPKPQTTPHQ